MVSNKVYMSSRKWINPNVSVDSGALSISVTSYTDEAEVNAKISIWDCSKKIVLDLGFCTAEGAKVRAKKLDIIINDLIKMRIAMGKAFVDSQNFIGDEDYG